MQTSTITRYGSRIYPRFARLSGTTPVMSCCRTSRPLAEAPGQDSLLGVQAVLGFVEHHRLRAVDHLVGDLLAAMRRKAVHEERLGLGARHQLRIDLIGFEQI